MSKEDAFRQEALDYHKLPTPGKIAIKPTTGLATQRDLALAYSPGVAAPCEEIEKDPLTSYDYTSRGNLVAVISNGTAVLGLGAIGALASKPVMEGKSVLFKKFANIDSVDIEVDELDPDKLIDIVASMEPTFGGINLEDIKAPECFYIERELKKRMNIPVFHDDQHGTAIIVTAAVTNWLHTSGRKAEDIRLVASGAGASAIACLNLLVEAGLKKENIIVTDRQGVVYEGRTEGMDEEKAKFASKTNARTLEDAIKDADLFLGLSGPGVLNKELFASMAEAPLIMALANPTPEIMPEDALEAKPDAIVCTGRSDFPNQVNNVLCFPFIFRGALDVGASAINEEMKLACVKAIAELARKEPTAEVTQVYGEEDLRFGPNYLIPKPFDPRLIVDIPIAVAKAAMESGVATRPIKDFEAYKQRLKEFYIRSQLVMKPIYEKAKTNPQRIVYAEGEEPTVLQAIQTVLDDNLGKPIIIGRRKVVESRIERLGLRIKIGENVELCDPEDDPRYREYWETYHELMARDGITPAKARTIVRTNTTVIGALMVYKDQADALICGTVGQYNEHANDILDIIGLKDGVTTAAAMNVLLLNKGTYFFTDTQINPDPDVDQIAEIVELATDEMKKFGIKPKVALMAHASFGTGHSPQAYKMREAYHYIKDMHPDMDIEGEMSAQAALCEDFRKDLMPGATMQGSANLFVMPTVESANLSFHMLKGLSDGISIGPLLLGARKTAHILTPAISSRGIANVTAVASVSAQEGKLEKG